MSFALALLVLALAVHRATHLVVEDQLPLVKAPREWIVRRKPDGPLAYLVNCFWCASVWVAAAAVGCLYAWTPSGWDGVPMPFALWAALSTAAVVLETIVETLDAVAISRGG